MAGCYAGYIWMMPLEIVSVNAISLMYVSKVMLRQERSQAPNYHGKQALLVLFTLLLNSSNL